VLTGTNRANVEGCSKGGLDPVEGNLATRGVCLPPATSEVAGRKELSRRSFAVLRPIPPVRVYLPPAGIKPGYLRGNAVEQANERGRVWNGPERQGRDSRSPGAVPLLDSASNLGALQTLRQFEGAVRGRGSAWTAAACRRCVRRARVEAGAPVGCYHHEGKHGRSGLERGRPLRTGTLAR